MTKEYKVEIRVKELLEKTRQHWPSLTFHFPAITYDLRGRVAGWARYSANSIRLNADLLRNNEEAFLHRTVAHELAHLVAHRVWAGGVSRPHGKEWQSVMNFYGVPANRCHSYKTVSARKGQQFDSHCGKCGKHILIGATRFRNLSGGVIYRHADGGCWGTLKKGIKPLWEQSA